MKTLFSRGSAFLLVILLMMILASSQVTAGDPPPFSAANMRFDDEVLTVEVEGDYAYVGLASGMAILDIAHPTEPVAVGTISGDLDHNYTITLAIEDNLVVASGGGSTFRIIDVSNPHHPVRLFSEPYFALSDVRDIAAYGDYAYVADDPDLVVVDISIPTEPEIVSRVDNRGLLPALDVAEDVETGRVYVYLVGSFSGLHIIDVTNPFDPQEVWPCDNETICGDGSTMSDIAVQDGFAYISYWDAPTGLTVWDVSDAEQPMPVGTYLTENSSRRVAVAGERAYLGEEGDDYLRPWRVHTIDVADKAQLRGVGVQEMAVGYPAGLAASRSKGCLFAAERAQGLRILCDASIAPTPPSTVWLPLVATPTS
ncbi:MAG: hypothetical protein J5I90_18955 [Caldilineales bacterium]|nr:hypothetical protein [Caldilineales bacterium]